MRLSEVDHAMVTAAVTAAEVHTDGEIVTVVARRSDAYHDVALHWSVLAMLFVVALLAAWPAPLVALHTAIGDPWSEALSPRFVGMTLLVLLTLTFLLCRVALAPRAIRMALTPGATKARRVRRQALLLFRTGAEKRTVAATGVLLYLSLEEHRAEIIADAAIHERVAPETWGAAMAALIAAVKAGRPGEGMAAAVTQIGVVLAAHFPRSEGDTNELPDRLIVL